MELKTFVADALEQIAAGVSEGRAQAEKHGVVVAPPIFRVPNSTEVSTARNAAPAPVFMDFDIAVSVSMGGNAKAGIHVLGMDLCKAEGDIRHDTVSRIRFRLPIHWEKPRALGERR